MLDPRVVRQKLAELRRIDPEFALFGASYHRYQLAPCIAAEELQAWEAQHGIDLPDSYRAFLLTAGNGDAGPDCGLFSFAESARMLREDSGDPTIPFPYGDLAAPRADEIYSAGAWDGARQQWQQILEARQPLDAPIDGALPISDAGCGNFHWLVLSGAARGQVWLDDRASSSIWLPTADECGGALDFAQWYLRWLDGALATRRSDPQLPQLLSLRSQASAEVAQRLEHTLATHAKDLDLSGSYLKDVPAVIAEMPWLQRLDLSDNELECIPETIGALQQLRDLDVHNNWLRDLPPELANLRHLQRLDLGDNDVAQIPAVICQLADLISLDLSDNSLVHISAELGNLTHLQELDLSTNELETIPEALSELTNLQKLDLSDNLFDELPIALNALAQRINLRW